LREVAKKVPLDRMLIETDSPYLAPVPYRGRRNEPSYVPHVAVAVAAARETDAETIGRVTSLNFFSLFRVVP
jgi:TatD DNase family protein